MNYPGTAILLVAITGFGNSLASNRLFIIFKRSVTVGLPPPRPPSSAQLTPPVSAWRLAIAIGGWQLALICQYPLHLTTPPFSFFLIVLGHIYNFARATWGLGWQKHGEKELRKFLLGCYFFDLRIGACIDANHPLFWLILTVLGHIYNFARATWGLGWQKHGEKELRTFLLGCFFC